MSEEALVSVDVDGVTVSVPLVLEDVSGLWSARARIPVAITPRADVSILGTGVGRDRAIADATEKIVGVVERFASARENTRNP